MVYAIKGFKKFQHFKDRKPPWVKLYRDLLDDLDWHMLDAKSSKILIMLWLIASESDGVLPDTKTLAFRLRMTEKEVISSCNSLSHWLIQVDIDAISTRCQETRVETETETETETDIVGSDQSQKSAKPDDIDFLEAWNAYPHRPGASKAATLRAWNARLKDGANTSEMTDGAKRYSAYCVVQKTEPQFIKQPSTFFGPDCHFRSDWAIPKLIDISQIKRGSDDYAKLHKTAKWWADAGFESIWNAMDAGCYHDTFNRFSGGKKLREAVA